jgi:hypothetical protein
MNRPAKGVSLIDSCGDNAKAVLSESSTFVGTNWTGTASPNCGGLHLSH